MLTFETWDIDKLIPYDRNPRVNDHAVDKIAATIKEYGFRVPIVAKSDGLIVDGHLRFKAARKLGLTEIPVILADDLTDAQIKAFRLSVNKMAELATWDEEMLAIEMQELHDIGYDLDLIGFTPEELEEMDINLEGSLEAIIDESKADDVPDVVENPIIKLGDLIELGNHRLLCGDSTKEDDVKRLMGGVLADMLLTDPPYNVAYEGKTADALTIKNDSMNDLKFRAFLTDAFKSADSVMKQGAVFYIWHADLEGYNFRGGCKDAGWKVRQCLIWKKQTLVMGRQDYHWKHEPCLYGWKDGAGHLWNTDRKQTTILEFDRPQRNDIHPTMKPVNLFEYQIGNNTKGQDIVLDLFLGSGTTIIGCENMSRKGYGLEYDPKYSQVIVQRWCDYTSIDTIKINGKEVSWSEYKNANRVD